LVPRNRGDEEKFEEGKEKGKGGRMMAKLGEELPVPIAKRKRPVVDKKGNVVGRKGARSSLERGSPLI